jgi:hypothetical protein
MRGVIKDELETEIDDPNWPCPRPVTVEYSYDIGGDELHELAAYQHDNDGNKVEVELSEQQKSDLVEEIWDAIRQDEEGPY